MLIVFAGLHGTGKSTIARKIAEHFGFTYYSTGMAFRELAKENHMSLEEFSKYSEDHLEIDKALDHKILDLAKTGKNYVFDGQMPAYMLKDLSDYNILLQCDKNVRIQRMANRDEQGIDNQIQETLAREESERQRFILLYNIDVLDAQNILNTYHFILDNTDFGIQEVFTICLQAIENKKKILETKELH